VFHIQHPKWREQKIAKYDAGLAHHGSNADSVPVALRGRLTPEHRIHMRHHTTLLKSLSATALLSLAACGGGASATIGGTVTGLAAGVTLTLQDNASDTLSIAGSGAASYAFTFADSVGSGAAYSVTVAAPQPLGQTCSVVNGSGTVDSSGDAVTNVAVTCSTTSSVAATINGLGAGEGVTLVLTDTTSGTSIAPISLAEAQNGSFAFQELLPAGNTYSVTVSVQPASQTCTVAVPDGTAATGVVANVAVSCS
jgi:hypothetical protein